jgi:hypothetical protein
MQPIDHLVQLYVVDLPAGALLGWLTFKLFQFAC